MKSKFKAVLLLIILLPFIISWQDALENCTAINSTDCTKTESDQQIVQDYTFIPKVYTQPQNSSGPILPLRFFSANKQKLQYQEIWQREFDYSQNYVIFTNHPIPSYKISLSVHTSDG